MKVVDEQGRDTDRRERILWLCGHKALRFAILQDRLVGPVCGSRLGLDPAFREHPNLFGGMRFCCWWRDACIYAELGRGRRRGFVIEWAPRSGSGGEERGFWLSLSVLRLHDAGQLPPGYLEVSFRGGVDNGDPRSAPASSPAFPARLKRLLRRALALPTR
jgi:hypothetical protein